MTYTAEAERLRRLVDEQAAVRRVATIVSEGAASAELFAAVLREVVQLLGVTGGWLLRYEPEGTVAVLASLSDPGVSVGDRWPVDSHGLAAMVLERGEPVRIDDVSGLAGTIATHARESGFRSAFGVPITVDGAIWGLMCVGSADGEPLPGDTEDRLRDFTQLLATAISNAESGDRLRRLADRQVSLRRVATLVAEGTSPTDLFAVVAEEIEQMLGLTAISIDRYEPDRTATVVASRNAPAFRVGSSWPLDGPSLSLLVLESGRPARIEDYSQLPGTVASAARDSGITGAAGVPIVVDGGVWGMIWAGTTKSEPLPDGAEARLSDFAELVAIGITNTQSRERLRRLADQQASLRRVATLAAEGASSAELFAAVAEEAARILDVLSVSLVRFEPDTTSVVVGAFNDHSFEVGSRWPLEAGSLNAIVLETGRSARVDDYSELPGLVADGARAAGVQSGIGVPIVVDGSVWGMIAVGRRERREALPVFTGSYTGRIVLATESTTEIEARLVAFTELVATAISRTQAHDDLRGLAEEQAALRRVAILVAEAAPRDEIFTAVAREVAGLLGVPAISLVRFEPDGSSIQVGPWGENPFAPGTRFDRGQGVIGLIWDTGRPARVDSYAGLEGPVAEAVLAAGMSSSVGAPIVVDGRTWGAIAALSTSPEPLSPGAEDRLASFTELVATAIANSQAHESLEQLAEEQAALRRVATLVARGPGPEPVFRAVAAEVSALMDAEAAAIVRFEDDGKMTVIAGAEGGNRPGERVNLDLDDIVASVRETRRAARFDTDDPEAAGMPELVRSVGIRSAVATPVIVEGKLWGAITIASFGRSLAPGTERRLVDFTDLVATAVANTQAREQVATLADEQAALRRLATLVVKGVESDKLFSSVVAEVARLLGASAAQLDRYEPDGTTVIIASFHELDWQTLDSELPVGKQWSPGPASLTAAVRETGRAAFLDDYTDVRGEIGEIARAAGIGSACGAPISVDGALWGAIRVLAQLGSALPPDTEARLEAFTEIVATAVSNAAARAALRDLAREQAALHRVAALVAEGADSSIVFEAVCEEAVKLFGAANVNLSHYTPDGFNVSVAGWSADGRNMPKGGRWPLTPDTIGGKIVRTHASARADWEEASSELAKVVRGLGIRSSVGAPVVVEGELWGALVAATDREEPLPVATEVRLARFAELIATAVSNAATRAELIASRARIVTAGDEARRRIERNLHDGIQQRLIALGLDLQAVEATVPAELVRAHEGFERMTGEIESVLEEVRELSRGLHPAQLARGGLGPSLRALVRRSPIPVEIEVDIDGRLPAPVETAVYYFVSEALTNAVRYSGASAISVTVGREGEMLRATFADDGGGGAEPGVGSGLIGLSDRVEALGGRFSLASPRGGGTRISIELPVTVPVAP